MLTAQNISRYLESGGQPLLEDVSLAVRPGERIGLVGPTGAGKTVLLRALAMLDPVGAGEIRWQDQPVHGGLVPEFRTHVMYLNQRPVLVEGTVEANLRLPFGFKWHRGRQFDRDRVMEGLGRLERDGRFLAKSQQDLSGGEGQLVALLRAIQLEPQVLLLDEPTAALDRHAATLVEQMVGDWAAARADQRAFVWVSHDDAQTKRMCDRILRMQGGRLRN